MKKIYWLLIVSLLSSSYTWAQTGNCVESRTSEFIQNNTMKVGLRNGGDFFWDGYSSSQYNIPYVYGQPSPKTFFAAAVWMGAYDTGGNLKVAAQTYRNNGNDYWAGPLDASTGLPVQDACTNFDRIWKVKRWAIERHIADFDDNGVIDGSTDVTILQWPGRNNPQFSAQMGFSLPANEDFAPFFDRNNNGNYEPLLGDFPVYDHGNGTAISEEILWSVFNDNGNLHTQSNGQALKVEVHQTAYLFSCSNNPIINQTLFMSHKVINKSSTPLVDFRFGHWADHNLGCLYDDYVGTLASKNTIYSYNQDFFDDTLCGTILGYGTSPPVQAMTFLNQNLYKSIFHINNNGPTGDPTSTIGYYRLLDGKFMNGTPLTYGGDGYDPNSTAVTDYVFPDHPNDFNGWSMASEALSGLDIRMIGSIAKDTLQVGESWTVDVSFSYHRDLDSNSYSQVSVMSQELDVIQQYYDNNFNTLTCNTPVSCVTNCVFPGDANNNGIANDFDILTMGLQYGNSAAVRTTIGDNWLPYNPPTPATNAYEDADGNGPINQADFDANTTNFQLTHPLYTGAAEGDNSVGSDLFFERHYPTNNLPFFPPYDTIVHLNKLAVLDVEFGSANQSITDLHAVTFRISYDDAVLESVPQAFGVGMNRLESGWINADSAGTYTRRLEETGKIHYVTTRLDQTNITGSGNLGRLIFKVKNTAPVNAALMNTQVCFEDFKAIKADGSVINLGAQCATILYRDTLFTSIHKVAANSPTVQVYPNPANQLLTVEMEETARSILLYNSMGILVHQIQNPERLQVIERQSWPTGLYTVVIEFEDGQKAVRKLIWR